MSPRIVQEIETKHFVINPNVKQKDGHTYFVAKNRHNLCKVELVFDRGGELQGKEEIVKALKGGDN